MIEEKEEIKIIEEDLDLEKETTEETKSEIVRAVEPSTNEIVLSEQICNYLDKNKVIQTGVYLDNNGNIKTTTYSVWGITDYINIKSSTLKTLTYNSAGSGASICFYDANKIKISCTYNADLVVGDFVNIPANGNYVRLSINTSANVPTLEICTNGNQAIYEQNINIIYLLMTVIAILIISIITRRK